MLALAYNKAMKTWKKIVATILAIISVCCLAAACILLVSGILDDRHASDTLEALRAEAESPDSQSENGAVQEPGAASSAGQETEAGADTNAGEKTTGTDENAGQASAAEQNSAKQETVPSPSPTPEPRVENPYREAFLANGDMAAWLHIPDTNIDYPVMWTPRDENYYLYRDFDGSDNQNGCLILDTDSSVDPLTTNLIIHGHNMRSGAMFGNLTDYEDEEYYQNHKQIILYTEECQRNYEVIAVFRSQVYKKSDQVFKFYKFFQADNQEEFDDFYDNIKALSLYDTGVTAEFGDRFLTLSTCVYHVEQGRFVVVAKEVETGDSYLPVHEEAQTTK